MKSVPFCFELWMEVEENHGSLFQFLKDKQWSTRVVRCLQISIVLHPSLGLKHLWALCHQANLSLLCQIAFLPSSSRFLLFFLFDFRLPWIARNGLKLEQIGYLPTESMNSIWWLAHSTLLDVLLPTTARGHESFDRTSTLFCGASNKKETIYMQWCAFDPSNKDMSLWSNSVVMLPFEIWQCKINNLCQTAKVKIQLVMFGKNGYKEIWQSKGRKKVATE